MANQLKPLNNTVEQIKASKLYNGTITLASPAISNPSEGATVTPSEDGIYTYYLDSDSNALERKNELCNFVYTSGAWVKKPIATFAAIANGEIELSESKSVNGDKIYKTTEKLLSNESFLYDYYTGVNSYSTLKTLVTLGNAGDYFEADIIIDDVSNLDGYKIIDKNNSSSLIGIYSSGNLYIRLENGSFVTTDGLNDTILSGEKFKLKVEWDGTNINTYKNNVLNKSFTTDSMSFDRLANDTFKGHLKGVQIYDGTLYNIGVPSLSDLTTDVLVTRELVDYNTITTDEIATIAESKLINRSDMFFEYLPTGFEGKPKFAVYVKVSDNDDYVCFGVTLDQDFVVHRVNLYRISSANLYKYVDGEMISQSLKCIEVGESESVYKRNGASDFTGGYHGDETADQISFYIDRIKYEQGLAQSLTACKSFSYNQITKTFETDTVEGINEATHHKETIFGNGGYTTKNRYIWQKTVDVQLWYAGICTVAKDTSNAGYDDFLEEADLSLGDDSFHFETVGSRAYHGRNETNGLSVLCTSELLRPSSQDINCMARVWDRGNQSKYYRQFTPTTSPIAGDIWESETKISFLKK